MHGRKSDADFGTGCRLPVAPPQDLGNEPSRKRPVSGCDPSHGIRSQADDCGFVSVNPGWVSPISGSAPSIVSPNVDRFRPMKSGRAADDCRSLQLTTCQPISAVDRRADKDPVSIPRQRTVRMNKTVYCQTVGDEAAGPTPICDDPALTFRGWVVHLHPVCPRRTTG
jgi:hypothetical protein